MAVRNLGSTGIMVSEIGFGAFFIFEVHKDTDGSDFIKCLAFFPGRWMEQMQTS